MNEVPMISLPLEMVTRFCEDLLQKDDSGTIELRSWPVAVEFIATVAGTAQ